MPSLSPALPNCTTDLRLFPTDTEANTLLHPPTQRPVRKLRLVQAYGCLGVRECTRVCMREREKDCESLVWLRTRGHPSMVPSTWNELPIKSHLTKATYVRPPQASLQQTYLIPANHHTSAGHLTLTQW